MSELGLSLATSAPLAPEHPYGAVGFLLNLAVILCVAAVTTILFQKLRQPVVLGYLLAGLIVGPYVPVPVRADVGVAHTLSEIGVILLMFSLGLEFSLRKLVRVGPTAGHRRGHRVQRDDLARLPHRPAVRLDQLREPVRGRAGRDLQHDHHRARRSTSGRSRARSAEIVFGILIVEDLIAIVLLAMLTAVASGAGLSAGALAVTIVRLVGFLVGLVVVGLLVVPRLVRLVVRLERNETTLVTCVGICFACRPAGPPVRLLGRARRLPGRSAGRRVGRSPPHRAPDRTGARHVRGHLLRLGGDDHRARAAGRALAGHAGAHRGHRHRQDRRGQPGVVARRQRGAHVGPGRDEPGPDRRVLLHHRRRGTCPGRGRGVSLPARRRGLGPDHPAHALADRPSSRGGRLRRCPSSPPGADLRLALRVLGRASAQHRPPPRHGLVPDPTAGGAAGG